MKARDLVHGWDGIKNVHFDSLLGFGTHKNMLPNYDKVINTTTTLEVPVCWRSTACVVTQPQPSRDSLQGCLALPYTNLETPLQTKPYGSPSQTSNLHRKPKK